MYAMGRTRNAVPQAVATANGTGGAGGLAVASSDGRRTDGLTERELEVVTLVTEGLTNDQIAEHLVLSPRTVQSHVANAMRRTRTQSRTQLAVLSIREGLVELKPLE
jgi:DNA-binding NarL/FixJ family response regulator